LATGIATIGYGLVNIPRAISNLASMGKYSVIKVPTELYKVGIANIIKNKIDPYGTRTDIYNEFLQKMAELKRWQRIAEENDLSQDFYDPLVTSYYEEKKMKNIMSDYLPLFMTNLRNVVFGLAGGVISGAFRDTLVAMLALVGMTTKLAADMGTGFFTQSDDYIYGLTETHFEPEDIMDLVHEMQTIESQRLTDIGYKPIDILEPVFEPIGTETPIETEIPNDASESDTETQQDIKQDIFDFTDIAFGTTQEKIQNLLSYIENIEE
jgi:hypothetical protein